MVLEVLPKLRCHNRNRSIISHRIEEWWRTRCLLENQALCSSTLPQLLERLLEWVISQTWSKAALSWVLALTARFHHFWQRIRKCLRIPQHCKDHSPRRKCFKKETLLIHLLQTVMEEGVQVKIIKIKILLLNGFKEGLGIKRNYDSSQSTISNK